MGVKNKKQWNDRQAKKKGVKEAKRKKVRLYKKNIYRASLREKLKQLQADLQAMFVKSQKKKEEKK